MRDVLYLKKSHALYGPEGRMMSRQLYNDLPNEHKKLFVTERTYKQHLSNKMREVRVNMVSIVEDQEIVDLDF